MADFGNLQLKRPAQAPMPMRPAGAAGPTPLRPGPRPLSSAAFPSPAPTNTMPMSAPQTPANALPAAPAAAPATPAASNDAMPPPPMMRPGSGGAMPSRAAPMSRPMPPIEDTSLLPEAPPLPPPAAVPAPTLPMPMMRPPMGGPAPLRVGMPQQRPPMPFAQNLPPLPASPAANSGPSGGASFNMPSVPVEQPSEAPVSVAPSLRPMPVAPAPPVVEMSTESPAPTMEIEQPASVAETAMLPEVEPTPTPQPAAVESPTFMSAPAEAPSSQVDQSAPSVPVMPSAPPASMPTLPAQTMSRPPIPSPVRRLAPSNAHFSGPSGMPPPSPSSALPPKPTFQPMNVPSFPAASAPGPAPPAAPSAGPNATPAVPAMPSMPAGPAAAARAAAPGPANMPPASAPVKPAMPTAAPSAASVPNATAPQPARPAQGPPANTDEDSFFDFLLSPIRDFVFFSLHAGLVLASILCLFSLAAFLAVHPSHPYGLSASELYMQRASSFFASDATAASYDGLMGGFQDLDVQEQQLASPTRVLSRVFDEPTFMPCVMKCEAKSLMSLPLSDVNKTSISDASSFIQSLQHADETYVGDSAEEGAVRSRRRQRERTLVAAAAGLGSGAGVACESCLSGELYSRTCVFTSARDGHVHVVGPAPQQMPSTGRHVQHDVTNDAVLAARLAKAEKALEAAWWQVATLQERMIQHTRAAAQQQHSNALAHIALLVASAFVNTLVVHWLLRGRSGAIPVLFTVLFAGMAGYCHIRQASELMAVAAFNAVLSLLHAVVPSLDIGASFSIKL